MIQSTQLRPGMVIKFNNDLFSVFSVNHRTPGNLRGFVQVQHAQSAQRQHDRASLLVGRQLRAGGAGRTARWNICTTTANTYYFMNTESYEQMHLTKDIAGRCGSVT